MERPRAGDVSLPPLQRLQLHQPAPFDRVGDQVRTAWPAALASATLGGATGAALALRAGRGFVGSGALGMLGALGGAALAIGGATAVAALRADDAPRRSMAARDGAPVAGEQVVADESLRVMSFNAHLGKGEQGAELGTDADMRRLAATIRREDPDVVLLQEVDAFAVHNGFRDMLGELADELGADGAVFTPSTTNVTGRQSGTAVLTFNGTTVSDARSIVSPDAFGDGVRRRAGGALSTALGIAGMERGAMPVDVPEYRPRATADVMVTTPAGNAVRVLSGHWSWPADGIDHPARQVHALAGLLHAWQGPTIVGGDFNVRTTSPAYGRERDAFAGAGLEDAFSKAGLAADDPARDTFGSGTPHAALDRIYGSRRMDVTDVRVPRFTGPVESSDHHPLVVDYELVAD